MGFLNPEKILKQIELHSEMIAADFGSGSGGWAIPLAKILKDGKVYAIDILEDPLSALKSRANLERINNIETICSHVESKNGSLLKDNFLDLVLITNLLFEAEDKELVISEAKRVLKKKGKLLIVDWLPKATLCPKITTSAQEIKNLAQKLGLNIEKEFEAGNYHYGLFFSKL